MTIHLQLGVIIHNHFCTHCKKEWVCEERMSLDDCQYPRERPCDACNQKFWDMD